MLFFELLINTKYILKGQPLQKMNLHMKGLLYMFEITNGKKLINN